MIEQTPNTIFDTGSRVARRKFSSSEDESPQKVKITDSYTSSVLKQALTSSDNQQG